MDDPVDVDTVTHDPYGFAVCHPIEGQSTVLHEGLAVRLRTQPRVLWIDAICIDQRNLEERYSRVRRIGSIYRNAVKISVWIGSASHGSALDRDIQIFGLDDRSRLPSSEDKSVTS